MGVIKKKPTNKQEGKKMKITIDKKYVEEYQMDRVKADAKEFGSVYTAGDLFYEFKRQAEININVPDIVMVKVEAFDAGWKFDEQTAFKVEMVLDDFNAMYKIRFFCDMGLNVDLREIGPGTKMYTVEKFVKVM